MLMCQWDGKTVQDCEIIGSYILNLFCNILDKDLKGLYRHNGWVIVRNVMAPFYGWGSTVLRLKSQFKETIYFLQLSSQDFLVLFN